MIFAFKRDWRALGFHTDPAQLAGLRMISRPSLSPRRWTVRRMLPPAGTASRRTLRLSSLARFVPSAAKTTSFIFRPADSAASPFTTRSTIKPLVETSRALLALSEVMTRYVSPYRRGLYGYLASAKHQSDGSSVRNAGARSAPDRQRGTRAMAASISSP